MTKHKHYDSAYRAHYGTSFHPEERGKSECNFFDEIVAEFKEIGADQRALEKFEALFLSSLNAKSNCLSSMIAGPSNFPVKRAEKANEREHKRTNEMFDFIEKVRKAVDKKNHPEKYPAASIRSDDENALEKLKTKLIKFEKLQEQMKACNKIARDKKEDKIERIAEILGSEESAKEILKPSCFGTVGFESYSLTNNNANIKRIKGRVAKLERNATRKTRELLIAGVKVIENAEEDRIQFFFDGKPQNKVLELMKSNGFKWSRNNECWQRLWNNNCIYSITHLIKPQLEELLKDS